MTSVSRSRYERLAILIMSLAFIFGWLLSYGNSVFFNPKGEMDQRISLPSIGPIGMDLELSRGYATNIRNGISPYPGPPGRNLRPPLASVLLLPLTYLDAHQAYLVFSAITICCLLVSLYLAERYISESGENSWLVIYFLLTTFLSYGFKFHLERGQFYVLTAFFVVLAISLLRKGRMLPAILALTVAAQLKSIPIIFGLLFISFPLISRKNLNTVLTIGSINVSLLFILGIENFNKFIHNTLSVVEEPFLWVGNHSILAYCSRVTVTICSFEYYPYVVAFCLLLLALVLFSMWRRKQTFANPYLFALCGLLSRLIPTENNDYTLAVVGIYLLPFFKDTFTRFVVSGKAWLLISFGVGIFLYTLLLFSFNFAWPILPISANKAPPLFLLFVLISISALCLKNTHTEYVK